MQRIWQNDIKENEIKVNAENRDQGIKYLASCIADYIAATVAGEKPATLMSLSKTHHMLFDLWNKFSKELFYTNNIDYCKLKGSDISEIVLFYHRPKIEELLKEKEIKQFLSNQGYKTDSLEDILDLLKSRYSSFQSPQEFPHEIGIFLGIPLKDVKGFMGLSSLSCAEISRIRWIVYGNPKSSLEVMERYKESEDRVRTLLTSGENPLKVLNGKYIIKKINN